LIEPQLKWKTLASYFRTGKPEIKTKDLYYSYNRVSKFNPYRKFGAK
jgi:hypothetical protein